MNHTFEILDDAGFLGLVNAQLYRSFIKEDWEFSEVKERIINECKKGHVLFWGTEFPNFWTIRICDQPIAEQDFKSFQAQLHVSDSKLYLINYESITLAAQFEDEQLPNDDLETLYVSLENGIYNITVRQLFDPTQAIMEEEMLGFEIVLQKQTDTSAINNINALIWSDY